MKPHVIILPGFFGSTLIQKNTTFPDREVWLSKLELAIYGPDNLDLADDGIGPGPLAGNPCVPGSVNVNNLYNPMIAQLLNNGWDVSPFPYDWRKGLVARSEEFSTYLLAAFQDEDFWVVCHSMGGLVARLAYLAYSSAASPNRWQRTVYLGTPHGGTYTAAAGLAGANPAWTWWQQFYSVIGAPVRRITDPLGSGASLTERIRQTIASWPGVYCCLPSQFGQYAPIDPKGVPELFKVTRYYQNSYVDQAHLDAGLAVTSLLNDRLAQTRPPEVCVVGYGYPTAQTVTEVQSLAYDSSYSFSNDGDGVVPINRGTLADRNTLKLNTDHYGIVAGGAILARINGLLRDGLDQGKDIGQAPVFPPPQPPETRIPDRLFTIEWPAVQRRNDP